MRHLAGNAAIVILTALCAPRARAQCQLANPSFELSAGRIVSGWNRLGAALSSTEVASHGQRSICAEGDNSGAWNLSAYWQPLDATPGESWHAALRVGHRSSDPLIGDTTAILNVEWRDANENLISFESNTLADWTTPTDVMLPVEVVAGPAPAGTVSVRLLLGVLQGPTSDPGVAFFDQVEFNSLSPPGLGGVQWNDFPGGRTIEFGGQSWRVKGPGFYGPGGSHFSDAPDHVWVDPQDRLHMTIRRSGGVWYSTEITAEDPLGYGDYLFTTVGQLDNWDDNVVLGLFTWQYLLCSEPGDPWNLHNEFDIEYSRWGVPGNDFGQFVAQPWNFTGNINRYPISFAPNELVTTAFRWLADRIECRAWRGGPLDESPATLIHVWTYTGPHIPRPEQPRVHINFWQLNGPPISGRDHEVILADFNFIPACVAGESPLRCLPACLSGPGIPGPTGCAELDMDLDADVDIDDFALLQRAIGGP